MTHDPRLYLTDILQAIGGIREAIAGIDFHAYTRRRPTRRAVEREIEIISEASRRVPDDLKATEPGVPWRDIAGIGNILRHDYQQVSDPAVWNVIAVHLEPPEQAVRRMLARLHPPSG
jgi:uncharacterized protein with HEPN domain